jgi:tetratricopeptide (TPR) repeat protein
MAEPAPHKRIFISYSQYDPHDAAHAQKVLALAQALVADGGLEVELDQFHKNESIKWREWCKQQLEPKHSDSVLMICTEEYCNRVDNTVAADVGRGVWWEGNLIGDQIYRDKGNKRFIPILLGDEPETSIPGVVEGWTWFRLRGLGLASQDTGYRDLYRLLTDQPAIPKPPARDKTLLPPDAGSLGGIAFPPPVIASDPLAQLRARMLSAKTPWELRQVLYELEEQMATRHQWPEARLLKDQLIQAIQPAAQKRPLPSMPSGPHPSRVIWRSWQLVLALAILLLALALLIWFLYFKPPPNNPTKKTLALAQRYLATGRYDEAEKLFTQVKGNAEAQFGAEKAALGFEITQAENVDMAKLGTKLDELLNQHKADADLQLLDGDRYYRLGQMEEARARYLQALTNQCELPEAHFRLGVLSDQAGDSQAAAKHYDEAFSHAPDTPRYGNNLAYLALKQGQYPQAIPQYEAIKYYPLAKLEAAKAHWASGEWDAAREKQRQALRLLDNADIANRPQNRDPWYFDTWDGKPAVHFKSWQEKHCYAVLLLAATMALNNDPGSLPELSPCTATSLDVKSAVAADLKHFVECAKTGRPDWEARSRRFRQSILGSTNGTACQ